MKIITTQRLLLEPIKAEHASELFDRIADPRLYLFIDESPPVSIEALSSRYRMLSKGISKDGQDRWLNWVLRQRGSSECIGYVQATVRDKTAWIAYVLVYDAWGKGYAREAVSAMIDILRNEYGVTLAVASVEVENKRSIKLLKELGFESSSDKSAQNQNKSEARYVLSIGPTKKAT